VWSTFVRTHALCSTQADYGRTFVVGKNYRLQDIQLSKKPVKRTAVSLPLPAGGRRLRGPLQSTSVGSLRLGATEWDPCFVCRNFLSYGLYRWLASRAVRRSIARATKAPELACHVRRRRTSCPSTSKVGLPTVARSLTPAARLRQGYGGQPSRAFMSEGWRIPGSNR